MKIINIESKELYNGFLSTQDHSIFQQAWEWGEYQKACKKNIWRLGVLNDEGKLIAVATLIKNSLPLGLKYFYCPNGPVVDRQLSHDFGSILDFIIEGIKRSAWAKGAIFIRLEPRQPIGDCRFAFEKTIDIQPSKTLIIDLKKNEEDLLAAMHQKTRYNIRLAQRKEIRIVESGKDRFNDFWYLMKKTSERDGFRLHGREHYSKMIESFSVSGRISKNDGDVLHMPGLSMKLFLAEYGQQAVVGNIIAFFGDTATYVHGASDNKYRNTMASFLAQWYCIKLAKKLGFRYYDFHGIDQGKWPGVTRFKLGFSGEEVDYPGTYDVILNKVLYRFYQRARRLRRMV